MFWYPFEHVRSILYMVQYVNTKIAFKPISDMAQNIDFLRSCNGFWQRRLAMAMRGKERDSAAISKRMYPGRRCRPPAYAGGQISKMQAGERVGRSWEVADRRSVGPSAKESLL